MNPARHRPYTRQQLEATPAFGEWSKRRLAHLRARAAAILVRTEPAERNQAPTEHALEVQ